jgi:6-phosphogluconate dehydrogenase
MQLGMIGLGRMGADMVRRLIRGGHACVVYDVNADNVRALEREGAVGAESLEFLVSRLALPRVVWTMIPAETVDGVIADLCKLLDAGDTIVDGGNSDYRNDLRRADELRRLGIHYVDVGLSGGVWGLERGYCQMIGGEESCIRELEPIFKTLAPPLNSEPRTPGREKTGTTSEHGYLHCGPHGAGHFVKMIHNGIEYGMMAAYAEGLHILREANIGRSHSPGSQTPSTLSYRPEHYQYDFDIAEIAELWRRGSVVSSWLLDLTAEALLSDPMLSRYTGHVADSGEGRWTVRAAVDEGVPAHVLTAALYERFSSRGDADFANRVLSAMRHAFGGHQEK